MPTTPWTSTFEANPPGSEAKSQGDNRIREHKEAVRERAEIEHDWGPSGANDDGKHLAGSACAFYQSSEPAATSSGATLAPSGRLLVRSDAQNQLYVWDDSSAAFSLVNNIDPSTMHDFVQLQDVVTIGGSWTTINGTTNKGAGTDLEVSVDVPSAGLWRIEVFWAIAVNIEITSDDKRAIVNYRLVLSGGSSTEWPAGHAELNSISDEARPDWQGQLGGTRMIAPATAGATYTFTMQHQETGSGAIEQTFGRPDGSVSDGAATHLGAIVLPFGA